MNTAAIKIEANGKTFWGCGPIHIISDCPGCVCVGKDDLFDLGVRVSDCEDRVTLTVEGPVTITIRNKKKYIEEYKAYLRSIGK